MKLESVSAKGFLFLVSLSSIQSAWSAQEEFVVALQNRVSMEELANSVTDPSSSRYQKFYTTEEIKQLVAPSDADYEMALQSLQADGVEIVSESPSHLFVRVRGERSYFTNLNRRPFEKPAIAQVHGLNRGVPRKPHLKFVPMASAATFAGITPAQIKASYGFNAIYSQGIDGTGQDIAIATYGGFVLSDITTYYTKIGITTKRTVDQITFNGTPAFDAMSAVETQTDAEFSGMIAPGANIHVFASADNSDAGELSMFTAILDDGRAKIINYSWGSCETDVTATHRTQMDQVFARAVAQGVNVMVATGDSGSDCEGNGTKVADYPAVEPYVVAVGGTTLAPTTNGVASETAWNESGGGVSTIFGPASFQSALSSPYNKHRSYPDVAFNADPNSGEATWVHLNPKTNTKSATAQYIVIGGTSIAAPQWSGFLALVGQARKSNPVGFLDPILYSLAAKSKATYFNDVTKGSDGAYSASAGWDAVTGWGSMKANQLLAALKNQ